MFKRLRKFWADISKSDWDYIREHRERYVATLQPKVVVEPKPKTPQERAKDILRKYNFCPIHLIKKELTEQQLENLKNLHGRGLVSPGMFTPPCQKCTADREAERKLVNDIHESVKEIEIAHAISVLKGLPCQ